MSKREKNPRKQQPPKLKLPFNFLMILGIAVTVIGIQLKNEKRDFIENPVTGKGVPAGPPGRMPGSFVIVAGVVLLGLGIAFEKVKN